MFVLDEIGSLLSDSTRQKVLAVFILIVLKAVIGALGGAVCWGTALQIESSWVRFPMA
jgi:hypothetical protein